MRKAKAKRSAAPNAPAEVPAFVRDALNEQRSRLFEAVAILELSSELLTSTPNPDMDESARVMSAVDGALRILKPIATALDLPYGRVEESHG